MCSCVRGGYLRGGFELLLLFDLRLQRADECLLVVAFVVADAESAVAESLEVAGFLSASALFGGLGLEVCEQIFAEPVGRDRVAASLERAGDAFEDGAVLLSALRAFALCSHLLLLHLAFQRGLELCAVVGLVLAERQAGGVAGFAAVALFVARAELCVAPDLLGQARALLRQLFAVQVARRALQLHCALQLLELLLLLRPEAASLAVAQGLLVEHLVFERLLERLSVVGLVVADLEARVVQRLESLDFGLQFADVSQTPVLVVELSLVGTLQLAAELLRVLRVHAGQQSEVFALLRLLRSLQLSEALTLLLQLALQSAPEFFAVVGLVLAEREAGDCSSFVEVSVCEFFAARAVRLGLLRELAAVGLFSLAVQLLRVRRALQSSLLLLQAALLCLDARLLLQLKSLLLLVHLLLQSAPELCAVVWIVLAQRQASRAALFVQVARLLRLSEVLEGGVLQVELLFVGEVGDAGAGEVWLNSEGVRGELFSGLGVLGAFVREELLLAEFFLFDLFAELSLEELFVVGAVESEREASGVEQLDLVSEQQLLFARVVELGLLVELLLVGAAERLLVGQACGGRGGADPAQVVFVLQARAGLGFLLLLLLELHLLVQGAAVGFFLEDAVLLELQRDALGGRGRLGVAGRLDLFVEGLAVAQLVEAVEAFGGFEGRGLDPALGLEAVEVLLLLALEEFGRGFVCDLRLELLGEAGVVWTVEAEREAGHAVKLFAVALLLRALAAGFLRPLLLQLAAVLRVALGLGRAHLRVVLLRARGAAEQRLLGFELLPGALVLFAGRRELLGHGLCAGVEALFLRPRDHVAVAGGGFLPAGAVAVHDCGLC